MRFITLQPSTRLCSFLQVPDQTGVLPTSPGPNPGSILRLANRYLLVDRKLNLQGCVSSPEADEELLAWPAKAVIDMGHAVRIDPGDDRWIRIHIPKVHGID